MIINTKALIKDLDNRPMMFGGQEIKQPDGSVKLTEGHELTIGEVLYTVLSRDKTKQFNLLKVFALAKRLHDSEKTDLDDGDISGLIEMMTNEQTVWLPLVAAQVVVALQNTKEKAKK